MTETAYRLHRFKMADAQPLVGKFADITAWDGDEMERKITWPAARVIGSICLHSPLLVIQTSGATITDAQTGEALGSRLPEPELRVPFGDICLVGNVTEGQS